ncbi:hypothetical protein O181_095428 [Austropuccinia psidii MF-1]|uniref:Uncharacterized protein n=1 Tax=Austropuccinia psidii MF-1 TaxID=1389203 RepID=A0A9Q3J3T5_9BASI|nr:hypothetical protein [Austropuccinia psidii MF-1]
MLEKGFDPRLPYYTLKKDLVDIHPTERSFKIILDKAMNHANICIQDYLIYAKARWGKIHKLHDFKVGDLVLVSTLNFNNIKGPKKFKYFFAEPFIIRSLNGLNYVQLEFTGELMKKHQDFPLSLTKACSSSDKELFPLINKPPLETPTLEEG